MTTYIAREEIPTCAPEIIVSYLYSHTRKDDAMASIWKVPTNLYIVFQVSLCAYEPNVTRYSEIRCIESQREARIRICS